MLLTWHRDVCLQSAGNRATSDMRTQQRQQEWAADSVPAGVSTAWAASSVPAGECCCMRCQRSSYKAVLRESHRWGNKLMPTVMVALSSKGDLAPRAPCGCTFEIHFSIAPCLIIFYSQAV